MSDDRPAIAKSPPRVSRRMPAEASLRPQTLADFTGQKASRENLAVFIQAAQGARRAARPRAAARAARPGQDHPGADRRPRTGGRVPRHVRPGDRQGRRPRRDPDQPAAARRAVHRRNPPPAAGDRGSAVSGDGGFPARPDHRRRPGRAQRAHRPAALHAGRRDHPRRAAGDAAARPVRHPAAAGVLHARGTAPDRRPRRPPARASR